MAIARLSCLCRWRWTINSAPLGRRGQSGMIGTAPLRLVPGVSGPGFLRESSVMSEVCPTRLRSKLLKSSPPRLRIGMLGFRPNRTGTGVFGAASSRV